MNKYGVSLSVGRKNDKRYKLSEDDILEIRYYRNCGKSLQYIATIFNVSTATILYHTDVNFRIKQQEKNAKRRRSAEEEKIQYQTNKVRRRNLVRGRVREYTKRQMRSWRIKNKNTA